MSRRRGRWCTHVFVAHSEHKVFPFAEYLRDSGPKRKQPDIITGTFGFSQGKG